MLFSPPEIVWTITGYGLVARTFHGLKDLIDNAEQALFDRWDGPAAVSTKGVWADGDKVFAHITSSARAVDGLPYANEYLYILTMENGKVTAGTVWLDLHAYYEIINRVKP
jgi:ketosteroid isomerase-like protein